jgi:hypothetical protein
LKERTIKIRGKYWFELRYAAKLLGTSKAVIETLVIRRKIKAKEVEGSIYVSEDQVTGFRRDQAAWKELKATAMLVKALRRPEIGGVHRRDPAQEVLPIADYRLQLGSGMKLKE